MFNWGWDTRSLIGGEITRCLGRLRWQDDQLGVRLEA